MQRFVTGFLTSNMLNRIVVGDIAIADSELKGVLSDLRFRLLRMEVVSRTLRDNPENAHTEPPVQWRKASGRNQRPRHQCVTGRGSQARKGRGRQTGRGLAEGDCVGHRVLECASGAARSDPREVPAVLMDVIVLARHLSGRRIEIRPDGQESRPGQAVKREKACPSHSRT